MTMNNNTVYGINVHKQMSNFSTKLDETTTYIGKSDKSIYDTSNDSALDEMCSWRHDDWNVEGRMVQGRIRG